MADINYKVKNRSAGMVIYKIPELSIRREFAPGEVKVISFSELEKLSFIPGGRELMADYLQVQSETALQDLEIQAEPEYNMSEEDVINLMQTGSLDAFLDCLDFAPAGVIDLIKKLAVSLPLNNIEKRRALKDKTGFDTTVALQHIEEDMIEEGATEKDAVAGKPARRVQTATTEGRRTTPKYNVVSKTEK